MANKIQTLIQNRRALAPNTPTPQNHNKPNPVFKHCARKVSGTSAMHANTEATRLHIGHRMPALVAHWGSRPLALAQALGFVGGIIGLRVWQERALGRSGCVQGLLRIFALRPGLCRIESELPCTHCRGEFGDGGISAAVTAQDCKVGLNDSESASAMAE